MSPLPEIAILALLATLRPDSRDEGAGKARAGRQSGCVPRTANLSIASGVKVAHAGPELA